MTKLEVLKAVEKALCSDVLDKFYSVNVRNHHNVTLQGDYNPYTMRYVNESFGLAMSDWSLTDGGYVKIEIDGSTDSKRFIIDGEQIKLEITLTD